MRSRRPGIHRRLAHRSLTTAATCALETMESRVLMSSTITGWNFNGLTAAVNWTPAPSVGTGSASSMGMTSSSRANSGPYPVDSSVTGESNEGPDSSVIESDPGSSDTTTGSEDWKIVGTKGSGTNGWNYNAPIGSQGAQFMVSTVGYQNIQLTFDWGVSGFTANGQLAVEYTLDGGNTWTDAPSLALGSNENIAGDGSTVIMNGSGSGVINGPYFQDESDTGGNANDWQNGLTANFSSIPGANNNPNFGVRLVNAATGTAVVSAAGTGSPSQSSANWRFDDVMISGDTGPVAPAVTTQPTSQTTAVGSVATFTAAASGSPTPTVQWEVSTDGGKTFTPDTTDPGNTTDSLSVTGTSSNNGYEYEAAFSNSAGSVTTNPATLTVSALPTVTTQPVSQFTTAGDTVSFTAAATGNPTPSVQWQISTDGGKTFTNIAGATSDTYTFTATEGLSGDQFQAVFSSTSGSVTTTAASLTVNGTSIAGWDFTGTEGATPNGGTSPGTANSPLPTQGSSSNSAAVLGMSNDYSGSYSFPEADILSERSTVDSSVSEYMWRVRGGGGGASGTPGVPDGWSQNAPQYSQGVQFNVNTTGYSNITLHFDWDQGGIGDMQAQYSPDGGNTWINVGGLIQATGNDFAGVSSGAATSNPDSPTSSSNPTGIEVSLAGIAAANNNPNFALRLVSAYDPRLPMITDGNALDPTVHGQYSAAGGYTGPVNDQQVLTLNASDDFTLTFNGQTTGDIAYSSSPATLEQNIATALGALSSVNGAANIAVTQLYPGGEYNLYEVTFKGALADQDFPTMNIIDGSGTDTAATWTHGSADGVSPFVDGSGSWVLGNINFFGDVANGAPGITGQPSATSVVAGSTASFTATAYSEALPTVQWQVSTNGGSSWSNVTGGTVTPPTFTAASNNSYTSTYSFTTDTNEDQNGYEYRAVFSNTGGSSASQGATLSVVTPVAPSITSQPSNVSVQAGDVAVFTASATGSPSPTVQWQINNGSGWVNLTNSATVTGATSTTLRYTTNANASENGDQIRAVFTNEVSSVASNAVTLTVLAPETILTDWDFDKTYPNVSTSSSSDPYNNSPAPVSSGVDNSIDVGGAAYAVGMDRPENGNDPATESTTGNGSINADDVTATNGSANPAFEENTWRVRGGVSSTAGGQPANGWSNLAPEYTQGVQFSAPTTGYSNVYVTMDWYATTSGILDAQPQYTVSSKTANITAIAATSNADPTQDSVTITANNNFAVGDSVTINNLPSPYGSMDGVYTITAATATSFSYYVNVPTTIATTPVSAGTATDSIWVNLGPQVQAVSNDFYGATTGNQVTVTAESLTNNVATMTAANDFAVGDTVSVLGADSQFNGVFTITAVTPTSFSYALQGANVATKSLSAATAIDGGLPVPLVFDVSNIPGAANNPNFGIRLVSAYNPILTAENGGVGEYANATSPTNPVVYNGSKGNWRFDNIVFHGTPIQTLPPYITPSTGAVYSWNPTSGALSLTSGTLTFTADSLTDTVDLPVNLTVSGSGASVVFNTTQHLAGLTLQNGASATMVASGSKTANVLVIGTAGGSAPTFAIDSSSSLNMTSNDLIVHDGTLSAINSLLAKGYAGGQWTGGGIDSSVAGSARRALGVMLNSNSSGNAIDTTFDGQNVTADDVLVKYTLYGDANLDGTVNFADLLTIAQHYNQTSGNDWADGDFNYDGAVNFADLLLDAQFYNQSL